MGVSTRDMTDDLDGINAQASDISFLITYAKSPPNTNLSEVAVVSWSWGTSRACSPQHETIASMP